VPKEKRLSDLTDAEIIQEIDKALASLEAERDA